MSSPVDRLAVNIAQATPQDGGCLQVYVMRQEEAGLAGGWSARRLAGRRRRAGGSCNGGSGSNSQLRC